MKLFKHITTFILAVSFLPVFSLKADSETTDVIADNITYSSTHGYIVDLGRAYPVENVQLGGVSVSSAQVSLSNDNDFPKVAVGTVTNISKGKTVRSKLYGDGGYSTFVAKNAVDGDSSTQFISTPSKDTIDWLTIDLGSPAVIDNVVLDISTNRTYTVSVTNTQHNNGDEFADCVTLKASGTVNKFVMPDEYVDNAYRYVRLRFAGDAPSDYYLDVNMYVKEITVNGWFPSHPDALAVTSTLIKNGSVFTPNNLAKDKYYRYIKIRRVSKQPTVKVTVKKEALNYVNVGKDAILSIPKGAVQGEYPLQNVIDENYGTITLVAHNNPYIQLDLQKKYPISHVEVYVRQDRLTDRENLKILVSNSPDFKDAVILGSQFAEENLGLYGAFVRGKSNIFDSYRYVRVFEGSKNLVLSEIKVFANKSCGELYNVAENVWSSADVNEKLAYRATDNDTKSFWRGNVLSLNLDRCYDINAIIVTAIGNLRITYGCGNRSKTSYVDTFKNAETKYIPTCGSVKTIKIESTDDNEILVYNLGVYAKAKNRYINIINPKILNKTASGCEILDLGRKVIIDHIEPCNTTFLVSESEDFTTSKEILGCSPERVSARYVMTAPDCDTTVIGYDSPEFVDAESGKTVEFRQELYNVTNDATAIATVYDGDRLTETVFDDVTLEKLKVDLGESASFMIWDGINSMKPILPKTETVYINKIPQAEFYVSPDAKVSGNGTKDAPFKTIAKAQEAVRAINKNMTGDIIVNLMGGRYYIDNTLTFDNSDSGTNDYRIIYQNAQGETPVITGGKKITGFKEDESGIWYAKADGFDSIYELTVNGEVATMARTEASINAESFYSNGTGYTNDGISFKKENLPMISIPEDAFVHVVRSWMDILLKVTSAEEANGLVNLDIYQPRFDELTAEGALTGHYIKPSANFYVENAMELLDNPGEFYFDKKTKILYYMPRKGEDLTTATVEGAVLDELMNIEGRNKLNHIENLTFKGIRFENSTFEKMYKYGFKTAQAQVITFDEPEFIDGSINVRYANNIEISDCVMTGLTKPAIFCGDGVLDSKIMRNKFYNVGDSAIVLGSQYHHAITGSYELCERVTVSDNVINNTGLKDRGAPGIACYYVAGVDVSHNKITNCSYSGISIGWGWNNYPESTTCRDNIVRNNYIENTNLLASDGGAIYTLGNQPGTIIEENYIVQNKMPQEKTGINAIYPDEGSAYITVRNNVIDMDSIKGYEGHAKDVAVWAYSDRDIHIYNTYSTYTNTVNNGIACTVENPIVYADGKETSEIKNIMEKSAKDIGL